MFWLFWIHIFFWYCLFFFLKRKQRYLLDNFLCFFWWYYEIYVGLYVLMCVIFFHMEHIVWNCCVNCFALKGWSTYKIFYQFKRSMWLSISLSWGTGADVCCWCSTKAQTLNIIRYQCHLTFGNVYFWSILWRKIEFYCHLSISHLYLWFLSLVEITVTFPVLLYFLVITLFFFFLF